MSLTLQQVDRLHKLLGALRDDRLSSSEQTALASLVLSEPEALRLYVSTMHVFASLRWVNHDEARDLQDGLPGPLSSEPGAPIPGLLLQPFGPSREGVTSCDSPAAAVPVAAPPADAATSHGSPAPLSHPILGFLNEGISGAVRATTASTWLSLLLGVLLASLCWLGLGTWITWWRTGQTVVDAQPAAPFPVAHITAAQGCRWRSTAALVAGVELPAEVLELAEGCAAFTLDSGVQVIVTGPSRFRLVSADRLHLDIGHLKAWVPRPATALRSSRRARKSSTWALNSGSK